MHCVCALVFGFRDDFRGPALVSHGGYADTEAHMIDWIAGPDGLDRGPRQAWVWVGVKGGA